MLLLLFVVCCHVCTITSSLCVIFVTERNDESGDEMVEDDVMCDGDVAVVVMCNNLRLIF